MAPPGFKDGVNGKFVDVINKDKTINHEEPKNYVANKPELGQTRPLGIFLSKVFCKGYVEA